MIRTTFSRFFSNLPREPVRSGKFAGARMGFREMSRPAQARIARLTFREFPHGTESVIFFKALMTVDGLFAAPTGQRTARRMEARIRQVSEA